MKETNKVSSSTYWKTPYPHRCVGCLKGTVSNSAVLGLILSQADFNDFSKLQQMAAFSRCGAKVFWLYVFQPWLLQDSWKGLKKNQHDLNANLKWPPSMLPCCLVRLYSAWLGRSVDSKVSLILFALWIEWRSKTGPSFILLIYKPGMRGERVWVLHEQISLKCCQWEELYGSRLETSSWGDKLEGLSAIPGKAVCLT